MEWNLGKNHSIVIRNTAFQNLSIIKYSRTGFHSCFVAHTHAWVHTYMHICMHPCMCVHHET